MANVAYEKLGLTKEDVLAIQHFLFPIMSSTESIGEMIKKVCAKCEKNEERHYAIFLIGWHIGAARTKEDFGLSHVLNPDDI